MYLEYYGLREPPFSITPDPRYVFLSERHRDALAHLLYGIGKGGSGGFVQLTGEVGTGKTTLCRLLLEQLPENTRVALVLNPKLSPVELVESICEELKLDIAGRKGSLKALVDTAVLYMAFLRPTDRRAQADAHEQRLRALPHDALPKVDVLIATYNEPRAVLEKTIVGALALDWPNLAVYVLDDGRRPWLRRYCEEKGVGYINRPDNRGAKAGNINHALTVTNGDYVAIFDADPRLIGQLVPLRIERASVSSLYGELVLNGVDAAVR